MLKALSMIKVKSLVSSLHGLFKIYISLTVLQLGCILEDLEENLKITKLKAEHSVGSRADKPDEDDVKLHNKTSHFIV